MELQIKGEPIPTQPQPLATVRRLRRFNFTHLWWSGGFSNQPYLWMKEIETVLDSEIEYQNEKVMAQRMVDKLKGQLKNMGL